MSVFIAKARARNMLMAPGSGEGYANYMYLDTSSYVTIGYGYMMSNAAATAALNMVDAKGVGASDAQKQAEWLRVQAISPAGTATNLAATSYRKDAVLFITDTEAGRLLDLKLDEFIVELRAHYPKYDDFPEDAQVGMIDMIYNLNHKLWTQFKTFSAAVNNPKGPDWKAAALASHRRPPVSVLRNNAVRDLFLAAAKQVVPKVPNATPAHG